MKNTTNTTAAKMTAAEVTTTAAAVLVSYKSVSALKAAAPKLRAKYGPDNWGAILRTTKDLRAKDIKDTATRAADAVFTYDTILAAVWGDLSKNKDFKALCLRAKATYKGKDATTARAVVRDYYKDVDATGAPLRRALYLSAAGTQVYDTFEPLQLTKAAAVPVLEAALKGMAAAAVVATRGAKDDAKATRDNTRETGRVVAVYAAVEDAAGVITKGHRLDKGKDAAKGAADLVGRPVPAKAVKLTAANADARAAHMAAAEAALAALKAPKATPEEKRAAKDATAHTAAKGPETPKAPKEVPAAVAAKRDAVRLVAAQLGVSNDRAAAIMQVGK